MAYFEKFPLVRYVMNDNDYLVVNVTRDNTFPLREYDVRSRYVDYTINDGDTPISIADKLYDDPLLDWTILYINKIVDYYDEWPMSYQELVAYVEDTYDSPNGIHHFESLSTGAVVDSDHDDFDRTAITNILHEERVNDAKRKIKLINPRFIGELVQQFNDSVEVDV